MRGILRTLPRLGLVTVYESSGQWSRVSYQDVMGYVQTQFLTTNNPNQPTATPAPATSVTAWVSTPSGGLNLRASASTLAQILLLIPQHAQVTAHGQSGEWIQVDYQGLTGYVQGKYLTYTSRYSPRRPRALPPLPGCLLLRGN